MKVHTKNKLAIKDSKKKEIACFTENLSENNYKSMKLLRNYRFNKISTNQSFQSFRFWY